MANFIEFRYVKKKGSMPGPSKVKCQVQQVTSQSNGGTTNIVQRGNIVSIESPGQITLEDALDVDEDHAIRSVGRIQATEITTPLDVETGGGQ